jgi:endonuclease/exonuclease/phosphatase family metal-dependent hydrolase
VGTVDEVRLATWNVHSFVSADGRRDVAGALRVIETLDADLIALQEVDARQCATGEPHPLVLATRTLGLAAVPGPTLQRSGRDYGNAILSRREVTEVRRYDLSVGGAGAEPRGAVAVRVRWGRDELRFVATHLGLRQQERRLQSRRLVELLEEDGGDAAPVAVAGDLNAWRPAAPEVRVLTRAIGPSPRPRTFPSHRPLLPLDRIFVSRELRVSRWGVANDPATRRLSDHLPLWLDVEPA